MNLHLEKLVLQLFLHLNGTYWSTILERLNSPIVHASAHPKCTLKGVLHRSGLQKPLWNGLLFNW